MGTLAHLPSSRSGADTRRTFGYPARFEMAHGALTAGSSAEISQWMLVVSSTSSSSVLES